MSVSKLRQSILSMPIATQSALPKNMGPIERLNLCKLLEDENAQLSVFSQFQIRQKVHKLLDHKATKKENDYHIPFILHFVSLYKKIVNVVSHFFGWPSVNDVLKKLAMFNSESILSMDSSFSSPLTIYDLEKIIEEMKRNERTDLRAELCNYGYLPCITDLNFFDYPNLFDGLNLHGFSFERCHFDQISFNQTSFQSSSFKACQFSNSSFVRSKFDNCLFVNSSFIASSMLGCSIECSQFNRVLLKACSFEESTLDQTSFIQSCLGGTHFLQAKVNESSIIKSNLKNTVFFGTEKSFAIDEESKRSLEITKPLAVMIAPLHARGNSVPKVLYKLEHAADCLVVRVHSETLLDSSVNEEIDRRLDALSADIASKPRELLAQYKSEENSSLESLLEKVRILSSHAHLIALPGGVHIPEKWYKDSSNEDSTSDYRRSLLEFALIEASQSKGIPFLGICRGLQAAFLYSGEKLAQESAGQKKIHTLEPTRCDGLLYNQLRESPSVVSVHEQGFLANETTPRFFWEIAAVNEGIVKAAENKEGSASPAFLYQFHPEFYEAPTSSSIMLFFLDQFLCLFLSKTNDIVWKELKTSAVTYQRKKKMLEEIRKITPFSQVAS